MVESFMPTSSTVNDGEDLSTSGSPVPEKKGFTKWPEAIFFATVAGASVISGFGYTLASAKKKDPEFFDKGLVSAGPKVESGGSFALRALGRGTLYAFAGCGILFYGIWKFCGFQSLEDFRQKSGKILPTIPRNDPPQGRTEFSSLTDLLQYLVDVDNDSKKNKNLDTSTSTNNSSTEFNKSN